MNGSELKQIYEAQLAAEAADPRLPAHDRIAAGAVLNACRRLPAATAPLEDEHRTWVLSDPHFEHEASIKAFGRPFRNSSEGDARILETWTRKVRNDDTVICLGDVTLGSATHRLIDRLRRTPGRKVLVAGNHDNAFLDRLRAAFDEVACCVHMPGAGDSPDLVCTHVPLDAVPAGCVNIHGHVHLKSTIDESRINVCVEQIGYKPLRAPDVRALAARLHAAAARLDLAHASGNTTTEHFIDWARDIAAAGRAGNGEAS